MAPFCVCLYLPGLGFLRNVDGDLENDIIYSDDDDDNYYSRNALHSRLELHPRIRQLTDEVLHFTFTYWKVKQESSLYNSCLVVT